MIYTLKSNPCDQNEQIRSWKKNSLLNSHFMIRKENQKMTSTYTIASLNDLTKVAINLIGDYPQARILAFRGAMGVGKTTFIKALCEALEVEDPVNSPSFAIINEYKTAKGTPIYHFDFYRIKTLEEAFDFGYEDYFYSGNYCMIEWPEKIEELLPAQHLEVSLEEQDAGVRAITVTEMN